MHPAFLAYVEQMLMPTLIPGDSVIMDNPADRRLMTIVSGITNISSGSQAVIPRPYRERLHLRVKQMGWMAPAPGIEVPKCGFHQGPRARGAIRHEG